MGIRQMWIKIPAGVRFASIMAGILGVYSVEKYRPGWLQLIITVGVCVGVVTSIKVFYPVSAGGMGNTGSLIQFLCRIVMSAFTFLTFMGILQLAAKGYLSWGKSSGQ